MALNRPFAQGPWGEYVANTGQLTVEQFAQLPDKDGWSFELHQGRLIHLPGPGGIHGQIQMRLSGMLWAALAPPQRAGLFGTACYYFLSNDGDEVLCPDLSYITAEHMPTVTYRGSYLATTPDWVIEIASPNDYHPQMQQKMRIYLAAEVQMGWVIWPNSQTVDVWHPGDTTLPTRIATPADTLDGGAIIPGWTIAVHDIFDF